jgi:hypothetical protein
MMAIKKTLLITILLLLMASPFVLMHGNFLVNIDLDFDLVAKNEVVRAAQDFLKTDEVPISFEYEEELIIVKFSDYPIKSVAVNGFDYSIFGVQDNSLKASSGSVTTTGSQRKEIAETIFESIPQRYQQEMQYGEEREEGVLFTHTWYRYKNGIVIPKERLEVTIDGRNGQVVEWKLNIFVKDMELLQTSPAITAEVAEKIVELRYDTTDIGFTPILIIHDGKPVWVVKKKVLYPIYVGVSALDGGLLFNGAMRGTLPDNYSVGKEILIVETLLIKEIYGK